MEVDLVVLKDFLLVLGKGALTGGLTALIGYMKDEDLGLSWKVVFTKKFWEKFSPVKALKTVLVGMVVGAIFASTGYTVDDLTDLGLMVFITTGVDQVVKLIVRRTPLVRAWNYLKKKLGY